MTKQQISRDKRFRKKYGITLAQRDDMWKAQSGRCAICTKYYSKNAKGLHVDHHHKTGFVRGLLCWPCNAGRYFERPHLLRAAAEYFDKALKEIECQRLQKNK